MDFAEYFPVWNKLTPQQQSKLRAAVFMRDVPAGMVIHNGGADCMGLVLVQSGRLRSYILSEEGREITIYRLFERDMCLFSASCMIKNMQFDVTVEAERDSKIWIIPTYMYKELIDESLPMANYVNDLMASHFSEVMWLMEQIMWKSFDKRLASFLLEESVLEDTDKLTITHEKIANHLGTAREVVTRMLRYFQSEGLVNLARGTVEITDREGLEALE
ncbi:MAG: Crp/Fnr family transcriptional regulator [Clostridia bacterium]|nr:Crp/Fnr family transcriptional regulator [Clostridia bacterium]